MTDHFYDFRFKWKATAAIGIHPTKAWLSQLVNFTDYLTKMGTKTVPHPPYSSDLATCDFWLFPKLRGCRYETTELKQAGRKVINTVKQEDFHGAIQNLLEGYSKCIAAGGDYFEGARVPCGYYQ